MTRFASLLPALFLLACSGATASDPAPADEAAETTEQTAATTEQATESDDAEKVVYACPMHPDVVQHEAGDCPECGMHLEKMTAEKHAAMLEDADEADHDDMHGDHDHGDHAH